MVRFLTVSAMYQSAFCVMIESFTGSVAALVNDPYFSVERAVLYTQIMDDDRMNAYDLDTRNAGAVYASR